MACLEKNELAGFCKGAVVDRIIEEISKKGYTVEELKGDNQKIYEIVDATAAQGLKDKEEVEIFAALFCFLQFYPKTSKVCFLLREDFDLTKNIINSLPALKNAIKEDELTDFGIFSNNELRQFQLKRYRDRLTSQEMFNFIERKIKHYANNLGDINLLIVLQSSDPVIPDNFFHEVYKKLKKLKLVFEGQILISYNENMRFSIINQVYPKLATKRIDFRLASQQLE